MRSFSCSSSCGSERLNHLASIRHLSMTTGSIGRSPGREGSAMYLAYSGSSSTGAASFPHGTAASSLPSSAAVLGPPRGATARSEKDDCPVARFFMRPPSYWLLVHYSQCPVGGGSFRGLKEGRVHTDDRF